MNCFKELYMRGNSQWVKFAIAGLVLVSLAACKSTDDAEAQTNEMGLLFH